MSDLIDRQVAIDALKICDANYDGTNCDKCPLRDERWDGAWQDDETNCYTKLMRDSAKLLEMPPAQTRMGKWIIYSTFDDCYYAKCDQCHETQVFYYNKPLTNFCPNCGADMREGDAK